MKNMVRISWLISILFLLSLSALGQVPLPHYDGFDYPAGQNLGAQTGWASLNTGDTLFTATGNLSYPGFAASTGNMITFDGAGLDAAKRFDSTSSGTVYYSFLFKVTSLGSLSATGGYFATFYQSPTSTTGGTCVWTRLNGTEFDIGVSVRITSPISWSSVKSLNTTYLIVASYEFVAGTINDVSKIWINPEASTFGALTAPTETMTSTNSTTDLTAVARVQIRQDGATTTPFIELDELRIGTSWADVTPASGSSSVIAVKSGLVPRELHLAQNYPNPFNPSTTIEFSVASTQSVTINIHDLMGREVAALVSQTLSPGTYRVNWDAASNPSGIYFYTVRAGNESMTRRMILMK
jgi:hypothetical protein